MAINEDTILGQDCELSVESATYSGSLVNWDNFDGSFEYEQQDFAPAASSVSGFVMPKERTPSVTIRVFRGLGETFADIYTNLYGQAITNLAMTDFPSHADMVARYGNPVCVSVRHGQGGGSGTADVTIRWGVKTHGYTPAA